MKKYFPSPLSLEWCPSHILEEIPWFHISDATARLHKTTVCDIWHNRTADRIAKSAVKKQLASYDTSIPQMCAEAIAWQKWLVHIAVQVALTRKEEQQNDNPNGRNNQHCENHGPQCIPSIVDITPEHPISVFKFYLPKWSWDNEDYSFEWSTEFPNDLRPSSWASISQTNWELAIRFFRTLQWEIDDSLSFAYIELAYHFHDCGYSCHDIENSASNVSSLLRKVINQAIKIGSQFPLVVGTQKAGSLPFKRENIKPAGFV